MNVCATTGLLILRLVTMLDSFGAPRALGPSTAGSNCRTRTGVPDDGPEYTDRAARQDNGVAGSCRVPPGHQLKTIARGFAILPEPMALHSSSLRWRDRS